MANTNDPRFRFVILSSWNAFCTAAVTLRPAQAFSSSLTLAKDATHALFIPTLFFKF
ncbi:hypothetical protein M405DRAFT_820276 [Rhizopogon salebrosus TDB-379]|nr:hypothetical protein M405DRAFT_820276 [Rhizopogon salebrosus TDB-379]